MPPPRPAPARRPSASRSQPPWREPVRGGHPDPRLLAETGIEQLRAILTGRTPQPPLSRLTGMRLAEVGAGCATFTMPLTGWLCGSQGTIGIGPLTIPADAAMACAIMTELPAWTPFTTAELALRQLRPARPGGLVHASATVIEPGPPIGMAQAFLTDDAGALIAHGSSLCITLPVMTSEADRAPAAPEPPEPDAGPDPWQRQPPDAPSDPGAWDRMTGLEILTAELEGRRPAPALEHLTGLVAVKASHGEATFALPASRWLCAPPPGRVQGGAVAVLAEAALSGAIQTIASPPHSFTPLELKLNYVRPLASDGREAQAHGRVIHAGRRIAVASSEVLDADGRPIAVATGSAIAS